MRQPRQLRENSFSKCARLKKFWRSSNEFPGSPKRAAGFRAGVLAVFQNLDAVDEDVFHPDGVLMRFLEGGAISDRGRIEHDDVGEHSLFQTSAMIEAEIG